MKNHLEFWSEHPVISNFWLIVHTIVTIGVAIIFATGVMVAACDWIHWKGNGCKKFLRQMQWKFIILKDNIFPSTATIEMEEEA